MAKSLKVTPRSVTVGAMKLINDGTHLDVQNEIIRVAVMIALETPERPAKASQLAQVRWENVTDLRKALATAGVDLAQLRGVLKKMSGAAVQNVLPAKSKAERIKSGPTRRNVLQDAARDGK